MLTLLSTSKGSFEEVYSLLLNLYGEPRAIGDEFAFFYEQDNGYDVEVSLMKGNEAEVDKALTEFLLNDPDALEDYVNLKKKFCYSKEINFLDQLLKNSRI